MRYTIQVNSTILTYTISLYNSLNESGQEKLEFILILRKVAFFEWLREPATVAFFSGSLIILRHHNLSLGQSFFSPGPHR